MNKDVIVVIENTTSALLNNKTSEEITEELIKNTINSILPMIKISLGISQINQEDIDAAVVNLEERYSITMDTGALLKEDNYKKWYHNSKADRGTDYWDRYKRYLENDEKMPPNVINKIEEASEDIMDVLGDPKSDTNFKRRGLVIGSVQSGKTSNYTALINKAADSGYKVIILLTGTIEKLRRQTQQRIDEGFVGSDSRDFIQHKNPKKNGHLGVGVYNKDINVASLTTTEKDFDSKGLNMKLSSINDPIIFVIKKNKSILEKLQTWLQEKNVDEVTNLIDLPLLIIDDEADNASVNTNNPDKDPTAINNGIRNLLRLFNKYNYVGFTATPFANIFIDPQIKNAENDDLFPRDFIYLLEQPSNYVGPSKMYDEEGQYNYMIRHNDDMEDILELKHKNGTPFLELPNSLKRSIQLFLIANAVRDLRGQESKHRSMLIHVSRFISVQKEVQERVKNYFNNAKAKIKNYALIEGEEEPFIQELHTLFDKEYGSDKNAEYGMESFDKVEIKEKWEDVKKVLYKSISPIQIHTINSGSASQRMNYDEYEDGLRLIAIGGLSLARGLTLEGLTISYFYRNTKMYDTLMQMGRWFGYRDGYADLCRLWTSFESAGWYAHIAEATEELRNEIKRMSWENRKPIEFGLRVRSAEDTPLIVTARNKLKHSEQMKLVRQLNGRMTETAILPSNKTEIKANNNTIERWLINNQSYFVEDSSKLGIDKPTFLNVPKEKIIDLLSLVEYPYMNEFSKDGNFVNEINKSNSKIFDNWNVVVATNNIEKDEEPKIFGGIEISPVKRSFDFFGTGKYIRMSKSKRRLGSTNYALTGLLKREKELIEESVNNILKGQKNKNGGQKAATQNMYFNTGIERNPLIIIYPVQLLDSKGENAEIDSYVNNLDQLVTGMSIGIPDIKGVQSATYEYLINKVYQMELIEGSSNSADWDEYYDEDDEEIDD